MGQGWGLPPTCQGQSCPVGKGSKDSRHLAPSWALALRARNQLSLSLWGHAGIDPGLTAPVQDPPTRLLALPG